MTSPDYPDGGLGRSSDDASDEFSGLGRTSDDSYDEFRKFNRDSLPEGDGGDPFAPNRAYPLTGPRSGGTLVTVEDLPEWAAYASVDGGQNFVPLTMNGTTGTFTTLASQPQESSIFILDADQDWDPEIELTTSRANDGEGETIKYVVTEVSFSSPSTVPQNGGTEVSVSNLPAWVTGVKINNNPEVIGLLLAPHSIRTLDTGNRVEEIIPVVLDGSTGTFTTPVLVSPVRQRGVFQDDDETQQYQVSALFVANQVTTLDPDSGPQGGGGTGTATNLPSWVTHVGISDGEYVPVTLDGTTGTFTLPWSQDFSGGDGHTSLIFRDNAPPADHQEYTIPYQLAATSVATPNTSPFSGVTVEVTNVPSNLPFVSVYSGSFGSIATSVPVTFNGSTASFDVPEFDEASVPENDPGYLTFFSEEGETGYFYTLENALTFNPA